MQKVICEATPGLESSMPQTIMDTRVLTMMSGPIFDEFHFNVMSKDALDCTVVSVISRIYALTPHI